MDVTIVQALQAVIVGFLVLVGQIGVARISRRAQIEVSEPDVQEKATTAWQKYAEKMETRLEAVERREEDNRRRISALEQQVARDRDLIRRLVGRLRRLIDGARPTEADHEVIDLAQARLELRP